MHYYSSHFLTSQPANNSKRERRLEVVQYKGHSREKYWQAKGLPLLQKFNIGHTVCDFSDIRLIRTDTTLDLSHEGKRG